MTLFASILVYLHIAAAAIWFGMALRLTSQARLASALGETAATRIGAETQRSLRLMGVSLVLAFLLGLVAFFMRGGFARYGGEYHASLLLVVILIALHYALVGPLWDRFTAAVRSDNAEDAVKLRKRIGMLLGIGHLIWLVVLLLMLWPRYFVGLGT